MNRALLLVFVVAALFLPASFTQAQVPRAHFAATVSPSPAHPGEIATVTIKATIDPGWHIYSVVPTPDGPSATDIVSVGSWKTAGPTTEDAPIRKIDPNFRKEVGFHENTATFTRPFRVPLAPDNGGTRQINSVTIHFQTCNDRTCLPPTDAPVPVTVGVAPGPIRPEYAQASAPAPPLLGDRGPSGSSSLPLFLLAALGFGLLAIFTPCVFPIIPITLANFVKQADGDKGKLVRLSGGYALGIVALYVLLGAVVTATVGATGINRLAANPYINLGIFAVFLVFALSFFETIQLQLPVGLNGVQQTARRHGGTLGLVLLGTAFVLASFTCTAPFVGTLLVAAAGGERVRPLLGTLVFALAFASPFLVFAAFPQWIARIPRGGIWLARVKATLGFVELAAALKFLSNADQYWQWKVLTQPVLLAAWAMIFFCAALYLWGTLRFGLVADTETDAQRHTVPFARRAFAGLFLYLTLYCFWGLAGQPIRLLSTFLPPAGYGGVALAGPPGLPWLSDFDAALAQAKADHKPLLIDFTGYTCTNCRYNENNVFPRADVQKSLAPFVRVQLYTDGKNDAANQKRQLALFGDVSLPLYGILDPQTGRPIDKYTGTITNPADFTRFLSRASAGQQASH